MEKKPSVLIVHNYYQLPGGEDTVAANEKALLEEHGHKVVMYTRSNNEMRKFNLLQKLLLPFAAIFNIRTYREIKGIIQEEKIDIVHVHNTLTMVSPAVYYAAVHMNIPVVQTVHNFRLLCPGATFFRDGHVCEDCVTKGLGCAIKNKCYRDSRLQTFVCVANTKIHRMTGIYKKINYICLTEFNKEKLLQLKQIAREKVFVKPNFTDNKREIIPCEKRKNQYVFVGRLEKLKGVDILLEAWKLMPRPAPGLILCGTGPMEEWCREYAEENNLDSIKIHGFVCHEEVMGIIAESKALIFPTQCYEGFPMTIAESYSCGTPVLGSDIGNTADLIQDGETGYRFRHDSVRDLYHKILELDGRDMVDSCSRHYKGKYDKIKNYEGLSEIYGRILAEQRGRK